MFWFSSTTYTGYGKGKYSHALPAGVAFIGLLFLVVGVIIAVRFPGIVTDWTKADVCIVKETDRRYDDWITDAGREVTISVQLWNVSILQSGIRLYEESQSQWTQPLKFVEQNRKKDIKFLPDHRLTFRKDLVYLHIGERPLPDIKVTLPNLWLLRQYTRLGDAESWLRDILPRLLADTASSHLQPGANNVTAESFWINLSTSDCSKTIDFSQDLCSRYSFPKWATGQGYMIRNGTSDDQNQPWIQFLSIVLTSNFVQRAIKSVDACLREIELTSQSKDAMDKGFRCPSCFSDQNPQGLLLLGRRILENYDHQHSMRSNLGSCYATYGPVFANRSLGGHGFDIIMAVDEYFFEYLRKQLLLDYAGREGVYDSADMVGASAIEPIVTQPSWWRLGVLPALFGGDGDHLYDWNTCDVRWDINADINFQWRALDARPVDWSSQSEYFVPPASTIEPCLRPRASRRLNLFLEGLWRPAIFLFDQSDFLYQETVYNYQLTAGSLPYDDEFLLDDLKVSIDDVVGFPSQLTPYSSHPNATVGVGDIVAMVQVEPITGVIWHTHLKFELSVVIPAELAKAANITSLAGLRIPIARMERNSTVNAKTATFLSLQLKPMLAIICGGVAVSTLFAMIFVGLALALIVKLHWKPFRERVQVQPEPQDLQLLNTIKLRKMLGN